MIPQVIKKSKPQLGNTFRFKAHYQAISQNRDNLVSKYKEHTSFQQGNKMPVNGSGVLTMSYRVLFSTYVHNFRHGKIY